MEVKILGVQLPRKRKDRRDPLSAATEKTASDCYHEPFIESSSSAATQSGMITMLGLLKSGKTEIKTYDRSGRLDETSWRMTLEFRPGFSHEETLHDEIGAT